jgi:hypothetical protein
MAYWTDDRALDMEQRRLDAEQARASKTCSSCGHSAPRKPRETFLEHWERDTRPERPKGFLASLRALFSLDYSKQFREEYPYQGDFPMGKEFYDKIELIQREETIICTLNPKHTKVNRKHFCSHFIERVTKLEEVPAEHDNEFP